MLDAVNYPKVAWQNVSAQTVRNCFNKAELGLDLKRLYAYDVNLNELALQLKSLGVTTTEEELQEFNFIDDKSSKIYQAAILEEAAIFFDDTNDQDIYFPPYFSNCRQMHREQHRTAVSALFGLISYAHCTAL